MGVYKLYIYVYTYQLCIEYGLILILYIHVYFKNAFEDFLLLFSPKMELLDKIGFCTKLKKSQLPLAN